MIIQSFNFPQKVHFRDVVNVQSLMTGFGILARCAVHLLYKGFFVGAYCLIKMLYQVGRTINCMYGVRTVASMYLYTVYPICNITGYVRKKRMLSNYEMESCTV